MGKTGVQPRELRARSGPWENNIMVSSFFKFSFFCNYENEISNFSGTIIDPGPQAVLYSQPALPPPPSLLFSSGMTAQQITFNKVRNLSIYFCPCIPPNPSDMDYTEHLQSQVPVKPKAPPNKIDERLIVLGNIHTFTQL